jgi:hypothetical protein
MVELPVPYDKRPVELRCVTNDGEQDIDPLEGEGFSSVPNSNKESTDDKLCSTQIHHKRENCQHIQEFVNSLPKVTNCAAILPATKLPKLIYLLNKLFIPWEDEKEKLEDINRDVQNSIHSYVIMVDKTIRNINLATPSLESSIEDVKELHHRLSLNPGDTKENIKISFESITFHPAKLLEFAEISRNDSDDLDKQIRNIRQDILNQQRVQQQQLQMARLFPALGAVSGFFVGYAAATTLVDSVYFGGRGKLVINGLSFARNKIIAATAIIGVPMFGLIGHGLKNLWKKEPAKTLADLNEGSNHLNNLSNDNYDFKNHVKAFETAVSKGKNEMKRIESTIKGDSKDFIFKSHTLLGDFNRSLSSINSSIKKINRIDVKKWELKLNTIE